MQRSCSLLAFIVAGVLLTGGCARLSSGDDLFAYQNEGMHSLADLGHTVTQSVNSVVRRNYHGDAAELQTLRDVSLPAQTEVLVRTKAIHPKTAEVQALQQAQVAYEEGVLRYLQSRVQALERRDRGLMFQAWQQNLQSKAALKTLNAHRGALAAKYGFSYAPDRDGATVQ